MAPADEHKRRSAAQTGGVSTVVFVGRRRCGASDDDNLIAWVKVTQKKRLPAWSELDADRSAELRAPPRRARDPTLLVLRKGAVVGRLARSATGHQIDELIRPYLTEGRSAA